MGPKRLANYVAIAVFALSFFLPAVYHDASGRSAAGLTCARFALVAPWTGEAQTSVVPLFLAGCVNPALALWGLSRLFRWRRAHQVLRFLPALLLPCSWWVFHTEGLTPLMAHFMWAGSVLFMMAVGGHPLLHGDSGAARPRWLPFVGLLLLVLLIGLAVLIVSSARRAEQRSETAEREQVAKRLADARGAAAQGRVLDARRQRLCEGANGGVEQFLPESDGTVLALGKFEHYGQTQSVQLDSGDLADYKKKVVRLLPDGGVQSPEELAGKPEIAAQPDLFISTSEHGRESARALLAPFFGRALDLEHAMASLQQLLSHAKDPKGKLSIFRQTDRSVLLWFREDSGYSNADRLLGTPLRLDQEGNALPGYPETLLAAPDIQGTLRELKPLLQRPDGTLLYTATWREGERPDYRILLPASPAGDLDAAFLHQLQRALAAATSFCQGDTEMAPSEELTAWPDGPTDVLALWTRRISDSAWQCLMRVRKDGTIDTAFGNPLSRFKLQSVDEEIAEPSGLFDESGNQMELDKNHLDIKAVHVSQQGDIYLAGELLLEDSRHCVMNLIRLSHVGELR